MTAMERPHTCTSAERDLLVGAKRTGVIGEEVVRALGGAGEALARSLEAKGFLRRGILTDRAWSEVERSERVRS